ncbi:MAG: P63C domain-containing protein [Desulfobaccales bacterium]
MTDKILKATHDGGLPIGGLVLPCAVLEDGTRVLSERGVEKSLGKKRGGAAYRKRETDGGGHLPIYLSPTNLKPFISEELSAVVKEPIIYAPKHGGRVAHGLRAEALPQICEVWLKARDAGVLKPNQLHIAEMADILIRGLARVGIIALIDEATGYQYDRDRYDLERFLAMYLSEERLKWARMFPDEFYRLIYKLKNWPFPGGTKRTPLIGKITNRLVYEKLPEGVLEKLRELNPKNPRTKRRPATFHQHLSEDIGQPDLREHLLKVITLLRAASNWHIFERLFARAFPTKEQMQEQRQQRLIPEPEDEY